MAFKCSSKVFIFFFVFLLRQKPEDLQRYIVTLTFATTVNKYLLALRGRLKVNLIMNVCKSVSTLYSNVCLYLYRS